MTLMDTTAEGNPWACSVRVEKQKGSSYQGQTRHDLRQQMPAYVDEARSPWNSFIIPPPPETDLFQEVQARWNRRPMARRRGLRRDANIAVGGIITFGNQLQPKIDGLPRDEQDGRYHQLAQNIAEELGTDLVGLVVHRDESAPHAHFTLAGYTREGYSVTEMLTPSRLKKLQDIAATDVYADLGAQRGTPKSERLRAGAKPSEVIHKSVRQLHDQLPRELAAARAQVDQVQKDVEGLAAERDTLERQLKDMSAQRDSLAQQLATEEQALAHAQERADEARRRAEVAEQKRSEAETNALHYQESAQKHERAARQMANRAEKAHARADRHERRAAAAVEEIQRLKEGQKSLEKQITSLREARSADWQPSIPQPGTFDYKKVQEDRPAWRGGPILRDKRLKAYSPATVQKLARQHEEALKQAKRERDDAKDEAVAAQRSYRDLVLDFSKPSPAGSTHDGMSREALARHAATAPCEVRYGLIIRHDDDCITIPKQEATQKQIAAALYRSCRQRFGDRFSIWGVSDDAADQIAQMAAQDGVLVTVTDDENQNQRVEAAFKSRKPGPHAPSQARTARNVAVPKGDGG